MSEAPPEVVDELYGAPPGGFVALRDARAKELRKTDRAAADAVKKLRKPSVSAAAVNRLAREARDDVEALMGAGEALRQAQFGGGDRDAIRDAARDEREAVERLVGHAGKLSDSTLEEVRETLHTAATDDETRELVRRGVLTEPRQAIGLGGFGIAPGAPAPPKREDKARKPKPDTAEQEAEAARRRKAKERVKAARAALREAEKGATAAERARDKAAKSLDKAERAAARAREDAERRRGELEAAESGE